MLYFLAIRKKISLIMRKAAKSITIMKYLGTDGEEHLIKVDSSMFSDLEARMEYLSQVEYELWANGEIAEHLWTRTSGLC